MEDDYGLGSDDFDEETLRTMAAHPRAVASIHHPTFGRRPSVESKDCYEPTGFGEGGKYMANKRSKLLIQNQALRDDNVDMVDACPQIFSRLAIYINGLTEEMGLRQLTQLLVLHGGTYVPYLDRKEMVTHIVASNLTPSKQAEFQSYKVVKASWLVDSAACGYLKDYKPYILTFRDTADRIQDSYGAGSSDVSVPQKSLMSFFGGKVKSNDVEEEGLKDQVVTRPQESAQVDTKGKGKPLKETMESLSDQGLLLAQAVFAGRAAAKVATIVGPIASTSALTPVKRPRSPPPNSDPPKAPPAGYVSHFPTKKSDRTMALLADSKWMADHTSTSATFIDGYFAQSRLHHLSTWKEELKLLVASLQPSIDRVQRRKKLTGTAEDAKTRTVFHVDFDCFFVSAGLISRPHLRGKPVAVCHAKAASEGLASTSEIASCSYEARAKGVENGMSLGRANSICPDIVTIPFDFELYKNIASKMYAIVLSHADFLQAVSIDEVLIEVATSKLPKTTVYSPDPALELAHQIRAEILAATHCEASIGASHNVLLARLATRRAKPANAFHLLPSDITEFLAPLSVESLPGIGWERAKKLETDLKVEKVGDLLSWSKAELQKVLGPLNGEKYWGFARGIDPRELDGEKPRQSVSAEVNYGIRFTTDDETEIFLRQLGQLVSERLKGHGVRARSMTLKVMKRATDAPIETPKFLGHGYVDSFSASTSLSPASDDAQVISTAGIKLMRSFMFPATELRGIAFMMTKLEKDGQSVDVVLERGQGVLSFGGATKVAHRPPAPVAVVVPPPPTPPIASPPPSEMSLPPPYQLRPATTTSSTSLRPQPSIIIISDSSESESSPPKKITTKSKPPPRKVTTHKPIVREKAPKASTSRVAAVFRRTGGRINAVALPSPSQVTDEQLLHCNIDPAVYRELPYDLQEDAWSLAKKSTAALSLKTAKKKSTVVNVQSKIGGLTSTKPNISSSQPKVVPRAITPLPPSPAPLPPSSPILYTDIDIKKFGCDPATFRELSAHDQQEIAEDHLKRRKALTVVGIRTAPPSRLSSRHGKVVEWHAPPPIKFGGKVATDDICDIVEAWVLSGTEGPVNKDVDKLATFLEKCADRNVGRDMKKASDILSWWKVMLESEYGTEEETSVGVGRVWWDALVRVRGRIDWVVGKEGCKIVW